MLILFVNNKTYYIECTFMHTGIGWMKNAILKVYIDICTSRHSAVYSYMHVVARTLQVTVCRMHIDISAHIGAY